MGCSAGGNRIRIVEKVWVASREDSRITYPVVLKLKTSAFNISSREPYSPRAYFVRCGDDRGPVALARFQQLATETKCVALTKAVFGRSIA